MKLRGWLLIVGALAGCCTSLLLAVPAESAAVAVLPVEAGPKVTVTTRPALAWLSGIGARQASDAARPAAGAGTWPFPG